MVQLVPGLRQEFYQSQQTVLQLSPLKMTAIYIRTYAKHTRRLGMVELVPGLRQEFYQSQQTVL
jgi:hypothetical protein